MWIRVETPEEYKDKSPEELIEVCSERLRNIYQQSKPLQEKLHQLDEELLYWWKLKRQEILKLTPVKKIPINESGKVREVKWKSTTIELTAFLSSLSDGQRESLLSQLQALR